MGFGMSKPEVPSMPKGGKGKKAKKGGKPKKGGKAKKGGKKPARRGRKSRYGEEAYGEDYEEYGEEYDEAYGEDYEDYGEEYDEAYGEEYTMVPGTYMTDKYMELHPGSVGPAQGQSASRTKTGKPTKPPTASVSLFQNPFGGNTDDAMMLSPMVEYEKSTGVPMNLAVVILAILFISFVMMRK